VPRVDGKDHPVHAIYDRRCLSVVQEQIQKGSLRMMDLLARLSVRYLERNEIDVFDPQHLSMFNINTQADLQRARRLAAQE
jgi:molybdopterin-guanine dinucleotide biosynthesis protein A